MDLPEGDVEAPVLVEAAQPASTTGGSEQRRISSGSRFTARILPHNSVPRHSGSPRNPREIPAESALVSRTSRSSSLSSRPPFVLLRALRASVRSRRNPLVRAKTKPPAEVGSAGGESGAFAWVAPPWWSGTWCRLRSGSALPWHVRPCLEGLALRTPCAPGRCEKDPSTRQRPVPLPEPCELCRVCRSPQQTPGRVTMRDIRLPFLSSGPTSLHRGRNSVGFGHLLWRMISRCSGIASTLPSVSIHARLVQRSAVCATRRRGRSTRSFEGWALSCSPSNCRN